MEKSFIEEFDVKEEKVRYTDTSDYDTFKNNE